MSKQILVAYASGTGSTAEVAEAIADELRGEGILVQASPAGDVDDVSQYDAVVLGSSIRLGRWLPAAVRFLERFGTEMRGVPVAYFTTCLTMVDGTEANRRTTLAYLEPVLQMEPDVAPVGIGLFAGSLDPARKRMMPVEVGPYGDFRDWDAIRRWARGIGPKLLAEGAPAGTEADAADAFYSFTDAGSGHANMDGADLRETTLAEADLSGTDLAEAGLGWADLQRSNLKGANLRRANLIGAVLREADLSGAILSYAILNGADLHAADLAGADLGGADLNWADLGGANLTGADLSRANVGWANFTGANLDDADLTNTRYNDHTTWPEGFDHDAAGCIYVGGPR